MSRAALTSLRHLSADQIARVVELCDGLEAGLRAGQRPRIEELLGHSTGLEREVLLRELLSLEVVSRIEAGESPTLQEYQDRFPEHAALVASFFNESGLYCRPGSASTRSPSLTREVHPPGSPEAFVTQEESDHREPAGASTLAEPDNQDRGKSCAPTWPESVEDKPTPAQVDPFPDLSGRFRIRGVLGEGGFGRVYLALDDELDRLVAIKTPHPLRVGTQKAVKTFLAEARILARLDHAAIVPVYDVGRTADGLCYIISKYIDGSDLEVRLRAGRLPRGRAVSLTVAIAEALHYAHTRGLVHRDVKTRNILLDRADRPYLADFGLALREDDFGKGLTFAGTPEYMSPEQARGEGHLVDGRSDVFSLGVVFYELLTGVQPFRAKNWRETLERIKAVEVCPPHHLDHSIPRDLESICLKALSKRLIERYVSALEMADELRHALEQLGDEPVGPARARGPAALGPNGDSSSLSIHVVPKGLRSYEAGDADFFLGLLPGPRDRLGLPEGLRFWKSRIEEADADKTFRVGLVYGPSGCGKSSLIKAGLLPRLDGRIATVFAEATPSDTESRLEAGLRKRCPNLPADHRLPQLLAAIRRGQGLPADRKLLVVIDQFEQWLHAKQSSEDSELVQALRQCDGSRVQALLIVRDDFWMSVTRFLQELDLRLAEGQNSGAVDLFDLRHATKVLTAFGRAFEALPPSPIEPTKEQSAFISQAISGLAQDGKVIPVQLSLFAEMVKGRAWTPATLRDVGGAQGVGVAFLDETFGGPAASPEHRLHQRAAREVLKILLPERVADIKGHMRSRRELLEASGYAGRPSDFEDLLWILDTELRLITPMDPSGAEPEADGTVGDPHYQLTHDYLVPALREWLAVKQKETWQGRAEVRLAERALLWSDRRERRQLPSLTEWLGIHLFAPKAHWSSREREMMGAATRHHLLRTACELMVAFAVVVFSVRGYGYFRAQTLVDHLFAAEITKVPSIIQQLGPYRRWADPAIGAIAGDPSRTREERLHALLALLPSGGAKAEDLVNPLLDASPDELRIICGELKPRRLELLDRLWVLAKDPKADRGRGFRSACALAVLDPNVPGWAEIAPTVVDQLLVEDPLLVKQWVDILHPVRRSLLGPLAAVALATDDRGGGRLLATSIFADYAGDDAARLVELIEDADSRQFDILFPKLAAHRELAIPLLQARISDPARAGATEDRYVPDGSSDTVSDTVDRRRSNAAMALLRLGVPDAVWPLLASSPDPRPQSEMIHALHSLGADPSLLIARLEGERDVSARRALLLALSDDADRIPEDVRQVRLLPKLLEGYRGDPDPGIHGAIRLLLQRMGQSRAVRQVDEDLEGKGIVGDRRWFVDQGHTMVVIDPIGRDPFLSADRPIGRVFAISDREVTVEQFLRFRPDHDYNRRLTTGPDCPVGIITWYDAAAYCRWLDEQALIPEDQRCYPPIDEIKKGMRPRQGYLGRIGHRLPNYAEWEYSCRAGTSTVRYFGDRDELLPAYAWFLGDSGDRFHPVGSLKPNAFGLFDMHGNAFEWCQESVIHCNLNLDKDTEDLTAVTGDRERVIRSGAFAQPAEKIRSDYMGPLSPVVRWDNLGFRVVRTIGAGH